MKPLNEIILPVSLTDIQHQIMVGGLLGDSALELCGKFPRMKIDRQLIDKDYLEWQFSFFKHLCLSGIKEFEHYDKRYDTNYKYVSFRTRAIPAFLDYYHTWYPNKIKVVPKDLEFSPLILAVWFCDDGCLIKNNQALTLKLSTEGFGLDGALILSNKLESYFQSKFPIYKRKEDQYFIKASTKSSQKYLKCIMPYLQDMGMKRKAEVISCVNLNANVSSGAPSLYKKLAKIILIKDEFFIKDLLEYKIYKNETSLRDAINKLCMKGYVSKIETKNKYNLFKFKLTNEGRDFFNNLL